MKTVGIILGTIVVTIGLIFSIVWFNFQRIQDHHVVVNIPKSNVHFTLPEKNDSIKVITSIQTLECEVVDLANEKNKYNQIGCEDGRKDGFTNQEILGKQGHPSVKIGDTVIATFDEDGVVNVRIKDK